MAERKAMVSMIMGPLGSGKTYGCIQRILAQSIEQKPNAKGERPTRWYAVRNTYPDLLGTTLKDFLEVFTQPQMGVMKMGGLEPPTFKGRFQLDDGTVARPEVVFLALDREDHVKKLRGSQPTGFWFNEAKELLKSIVIMAIARVGRFPTSIAGGVDCTWRGAVGDTNACDEDHWYYKLAEEERPEFWKFFRQPGGVLATDAKDQRGRIIWRDNEVAENLANLPNQYYRTSMSAAEEDWISVNLANNYGFCTSGKPVHPGYQDSIHCLAEEPELDLRDLIVGVDFGRTPAAAIIHKDPHFGRFTCIDEFVTEDMSAALFGPELKLYLQATYPSLPVSGWGDPAGLAKGQATEATPIDVMRAAGLSIQAAPSNAPILRRAAVSKPLRENCMDGRPRLLISPKARMIRKGLMGGFCHRRMQISGSERYTEEPDKNQYSHPVEALEYGLLGAGEFHAALRGPVRQQRDRGRPRFARMAGR